MKESAVPDDVIDEGLGIVVSELDHDRKESIPFHEQPSKWDTKLRAAPQSRMLF